MVYEKKFNIGIVDQPNANFDSDSLNIKPHADALTNFIERCDTPITIGIQGEWGSGKTSLLNLIENNLNGDNPKHEDNKGKFLQIWVNAWEHSLLSKPEETLLKIVNQIINDMVAELDKGDSAKEQIKSKFSVLAKGALRVATTAVAGNEASKVVDELIGDNSNVISELKSQLNSLAKTINNTEKGRVAQYEKIVIYVDDLDRIDPPDAVAILELLKNIFNVRHCIFVLAIDYQVVIKGLKDKFGERTDENEWEFRAFFDKIIQLPFMMPVSQYDIGNYVEQLLEQIGFLVKDQEVFDKMDTPIDEMIKQIVKLSIGGNPRALKRLVNSLSLIQIFADLKSTEEQENNELNETEKDMLMFSIMCMQIKYPEIYDVISKYPDFRHWDDKVALEVTDRKEESNDFPNFEKDFETACGVTWEEYKLVRREGKELKYDTSGARAEFDEYWERVLFIICYSNPRYRRRADDISNLLSFIDKKILKEKSGEATTEAIRFIVNQTSVTSVTTTDDLKTDVQKKGNATYYSNLSSLIENSDNLNDCPEYLTNLILQLHDKILEKDNALSATYTRTSGVSIFYEFEKKKEKCLQFGIKVKGKGSKKTFKAELLLLRLERMDYRRPKFGSLEISDIASRPYIKSKRMLKWNGGPWGYAYYQILDSYESINEHFDIVNKLIDESINEAKSEKKLKLTAENQEKLSQIFTSEDYHGEHDGLAEPYKINS